MKIKKRYSHAFYDIINPKSVSIYAQQNIKLMSFIHVAQ